MKLIKRGLSYKLGMFGLVLLCALLNTVNAQRLTALDTVTLSDGSMQLRYHFDKNVQAPKSFYMKDQNLLVVDFISTGLNQTLSNKVVNNNLLVDIQNIYANQKVRSTIKLKPSVTHKVSHKNNEVTITLAQEDRFAIGQAAWDGSVQSNKSSLEIQKPAGEDVSFYRNSQGAGVIELFLPNGETQVQLTDEQTRGLIVTIPGVLWNPDQVRRIEVTDFATPVSALEVINSNGAATVRVRTQSSYEYSAQQVGAKYQLIIRPKVKVDKQAKTALGAQDDFIGELISINFQDIDVRAILQIIADFTGLNIVVSDSVDSRITIRLQNVPWDQALDVVLRAKGLVKQQSGNVVYILPQSEAKSRVPELITEIIQINNAKATDIGTILSTSKANQEEGRSQSTGISQFGQLTVDPNQNLLIVRDTPEQMRIIRELVERLDKPLRQVVINAQIVVTSDNYARELGVKWGALGISRGGAKPVDIGDTGIKWEEGALPDKGGIWGGAGSFIDGQGSLGLSILRKGFNANLELRASQTNGLSEILSSPTLMTTDRQEAYINDGSEIPFTTRDSDGNMNTEFKEVVMELKVTPSITPDDNIIMDLEIKKDDVGAVVNGQTSTLTREIKTQAIVRDGETVMLGGIYQVTSRDDVTKVPFLGDLPFVGNFFKNKENSQNKMEMVIFLTPNIVR